MNLLLIIDFKVIFLDSLSKSVIYIFYILTLIPFLFLLFVNKYNYKFKIFENISSVVLIIYNLVSLFLIFLLFLNMNFDNLNLMLIYSYEKIFELNTYKNNNLINYYNLDLFSLIILFLANFVGGISKNAIDARLKLNELISILLINYFNLIITYYIFTDNISLFFILYECLLIPSFFIVYFISYSQRSIQASLYFLIWTQFGSLLALIGFLLTITLLKVTYFTEFTNFFFTKTENNYSILWLIFFLLFFGFGAKVPIIVFQYWITKTHVEASGGFSIYLSGFLVKTAIYGLYKFLPLFGFINSSYSNTFFIFIIFYGIIDSSLKFWFQSDFKKLIAYCTIQEMNIILFLLLVGLNKELLIISIIFVFTHAILSALLFYLVEILYYRFQSRNINIISGLFLINPNLGNLILIIKLLFIGIPGSLKFIIEFMFIFQYLDELFFITIIFILFNILAATGFVKTLLNINFGLINNLSKCRVFLDITNKEFSLLISTILLQIIPIFLLTYIY